MMRRKKKESEDPSAPPKTMTAAAMKRSKKKDLVRLAPAPDAPPVAERPKDLNELRVSLQALLDEKHGPGLNVATGHVLERAEKARTSTGKWCLVVFVPDDRTVELPAEHGGVPINRKTAVVVPKAWGKAAK